MYMYVFILQDNVPHLEIGSYVYKTLVSLQSTKLGSECIGMFFLTTTLFQEFLRREVKPQNKVQLIDGIACFWRSVTVEKCRKYIGHLQKVIPRMIEVQGEATGF